MWSPPRPGIEPAFPALADGFLNTRPPGKPNNLFYIMQSQIRGVHFTVLVSYLDKEGIWQAQILYVMIGIMML